MKNIIIRKAMPEEAEKIIDINIEVWNSTYKGFIPQEIIDKLQSKDNGRVERKRQSLIDNNDNYVAVVDNQVVGYSSFGKCRDENYNDSGEIYAGYILDEYQGLGLGRMLAIACMEELLNDGYKTLVTKCLDFNPSNAFHKSLGGTLVGKSSFDALGIHIGMENIYYHDDLKKSIEYNKEIMKRRYNGNKKSI